MTEREKAKAMRLLRAHLTPRQRKMLRYYGFFYLRARNGAIYALTNGWTFYLINKHTGKPVGPGRQCGIPHNYPRADRLLAQVLVLRSAPNILLREACSLGPPTRFKALREGSLFKTEHY